MVDLCCCARTFCSCGERVQASRGGFSCCTSRAQRAPVAAAARELSTCTRAGLLCGTWDLPGPGIKLVYWVALQGGFSTTGSPGKPGS